MSDQEKKPAPDVAYAVRVQRQYRGDNLYIICVYGEDGELAEVMLSQTVGGPLNACTTAGLEMVAEMVTDMIQRGGVARAIEIASRTSLGGSTLPGILACVLEQHGQLQVAG